MSSAASGTISGVRLALCSMLLGCGRIDFAASAQVGPDGRSDAVPRSYPAAVLEDQPIAYYRMGASGGTVAADASGSARDGEFTVAGGTLGFGRAGAIVGDPDTAVQMIGTGNSPPATQAAMNLPPEAFAFAGDFSIEGWILPGGPSPDGFRNLFVMWEDYMVRGFRTGWKDDYLLVCWTSQSGEVTNSDIYATTPMVQGAWNHVVITRSAADIAIYLDGQQVGLGPLALLPPTATSTNGLGSVNGMPTDAVFDELAVYDRALSPDRVAIHFAAAGR
jgi:hypothetical protein